MSSSMPFQSRISAEVTLKGMSPYSQSRKHDAPKLEGESPEDQDIRTWKQHLNLGRDGLVVIPAFALHDCLVTAAKYSGRKIQGAGQKTWTAKFESGIVLLEDAPLNVHPDDVQCIALSVHSNGQRGSGKRVTRRYPIISDWQTTFTIHVLDPVITEPILTEMLQIAGLFVGLGRFRPQNRGSNGRFTIAKLVWQEDRQFALAA
jgi:hypothetical protein